MGMREGLGKIAKNHVKRKQFRKMPINMALAKFNKWGGGLYELVEIRKKIYIL